MVAQWHGDAQARGRILVADSWGTAYYRVCTVFLPPTRLAGVVAIHHLGKDYEVLPASSEAMIYVAMTRLMVRCFVAT